MSWKHILALTGTLAAPFLFCAKMRKGKDKTSHGHIANCVLSLQDSSINAPQQTLNCTHRCSVTGDGPAETIGITVLLRYVHWLIVVKSWGALGSNWLLYQARTPLLPLFLWLLPPITASGKCNLPSHLSSARLMGFSPADSFGIIFNNLIFPMLLSDCLSQSKHKGDGKLYDWSAFPWKQLLAFLS